MIETHDILRLKGFLAVAGKEMRHVVQAVGARISGYYDRPWGADEARAGRLVVIGRKGLPCDLVPRRSRRRSRADHGRAVAGNTERGLAGMHLLAAAPGTIADGSEAVDLGQTPGDIVVLSAADSELACLARALRAGRPASALRLANLMRLGHPLSVDLYVEQVIAKRGWSWCACSAGAAIGPMASSR